jgi:hypothetical protein
MDTVAMMLLLMVAIPCVRTTWLDLHFLVAKRTPVCAFLDPGQQKDKVVLN